MDAEPFAGVRDEGMGVGAAVMQVMRMGNPQQVRRAREILAEARRSLYRLLAEDDAPGQETPTA